MCEDRITPVVEGILESVIAYGDDCGLPGWCRTSLTGGLVVWDKCCDCGDGQGQLWVRVIGWETDPVFPAPGPTGCDQPSLLIVGVGSLRCVPTIDESLQIPTAAEETAAAAQILWDADVIRNAVMCHLEERFWVSWAPFDWSGGCGGGEHTFQIPFLPCRCDEDQTS